MSPYYDTIEEDLTRAREILERGKWDPEDRFRVAADAMNRIEGARIGAGAIYGADTYAAYKLLESFVEEIERLRHHIAATTLLDPPLNLRRPDQS